MPLVSEFNGIRIYLYWDDHSPPHFHAEYGEFEITVQIDSGAVTGKFPRRALNIVLEWYALHKAELAEDWSLAESKQPLKTIDPLE